MFGTGLLQIHIAVLADSLGFNSPEAFGAHTLGCAERHRFCTPRSNRGRRCTNTSGPFDNLTDIHPASLLDRSRDTLCRFPATFHLTQYGTDVAESLKRPLEAAMQRNRRLALHQLVGQIHDGRFIKGFSSETFARKVK